MKKIKRYKYVNPKTVKKYKRGFTLVELVATITILGIISLAALPVISNVSEGLTMRKFEMFEESLLDAGKLYVDQSKEDLFGDADDGCSDIAFDEIQGKNLIEDIDVDGATCASPNTFVRVSKKGTSYEYEVSIECALKGKIIYKKIKAPQATCPGVGDFNGGIGNTGGPDPDPDWTPRPSTPDIPYVSSNSIISSDPKESSTAAKSKNANILVSDDKGFAPNVKIRYYWINADTNAVVGDKKEKDFKNALVKTATTLKEKVTTPSGFTGNLKLVVEPINVVTSTGVQVRDSYTSGIFKVDNTPPNIKINIYKESGGGKTGSVLQSKTNADAAITTWQNYGYYFDFSESNDSSGIKSQKWEWNTSGNTSLSTNLNGGSNTDNALTNKTFTGKGARYGKVTICDKADNCRSQTVTVYISTTYYINYSGNGNNSGSTSRTTCYYGIDCTLAGSGFSRTGYNFSQWNINGTNYPAGGKVKNLTSTDGGSVTATAQWSVRSFTVFYKVWGNNWATRSVPYGGGIDTSLNPQSYVGEFYQFNGWQGNPGTMPANDVTLTANIGDQMCCVVTGHAGYYRVSAFVDVFTRAGWSGSRIEEYWWEGTKYYRVVTNWNMTRTQAEAALNFVWNNTSPTGDHALNFIAMECANGYSYYKRRPWS